MSAEVVVNTRSAVKLKINQYRSVKLKILARDRKFTVSTGQKSVLKILN